LGTTLIPVEPRLESIRGILGMQAAAQARFVGRRVPIQKTQLKSSKRGLALGLIRGHLGHLGVKADGTGLSAHCLADTPRSA
jgi:hypothetical protein